MITAAVFCGLVATGLAALVRVLPWSPAWKQRKPLSCPACMAGHGSWITVLVLSLLDQIPLFGLVGGVAIWLAATGVATALLGLSGLFLSLDG